MIEDQTFGGVIINNLGHILPYTVRGTLSQCEESAIEMWGEEAWEKLKEMGTKIVPCKIIVEQLAGLE